MNNENFLEMNTSFTKQKTMLTDLLRDKKISQLSSIVRPPQNFDEKSIIFHQASRQKTFIHSKLYLEEHEKYLAQLKLIKQNSTLTDNDSLFQEISKPKGSFLSNVKKIQKRKQNDIASSSSSEERINHQQDCKKCTDRQKEVEANNNQKKNKVTGQLNDLKMIIQQSDSLNKMFVQNFGHTDKMQFLWDSGKHLKLISKLLKSVTQVFTKLLSVTIDDLQNQLKPLRETIPLSMDVPTSSNPYFHEKPNRNNYYFTRKYFNFYYLYKEKKQELQKSSLSKQGHKFVTEETHFSQCSQSKQSLNNYLSSQATSQFDQDKLKITNTDSTPKLKKQMITMPHLKNQSKNLTQTSQESIPQKKHVNISESKKKNL